MASQKETTPSSRYLTHRPPLATTNSGAIPARTSHSRNNSHSVLSASLNANHRVSRRKSVTSTSPNPNALAAALKEANTVPMSIADGDRQPKTGGPSGSAVAGSLPSPPASLPSQKFMSIQGRLAAQENAIDDTNDVSSEDAAAAAQQARARRASDGQPMGKDGRKNKAEVRCEKCGKGYKHGSCLTKHLWEHTPEWSITSRLLISKHQQVQLLEAASVLMSINNTNTPPESTKDTSSDQASPSPAPSGSEEQDGRSSAGTTPPPAMLGGMGFSQRDPLKRYSSGGGFGRSLPAHAASLPNAARFGQGQGPLGQRRQDHRPPSAGNGATGQDDRDLAAAVELLSCSHNSNNGLSPSFAPSDVPPIPALPSQYLDPTMPGAGFLNSFPSQAPESFTRGDFRRHSHRGSRQDEAEDSVMEDDDDESRSRLRSEDDDEGVFGRMEE